jgi:hypothetical protein
LNEVDPILGSVRATLAWLKPANGTQALFKKWGT